MKYLTPQTVKDRLECEAGKICFVDVRSEDEFKSGHTPGAICVPLDKIEKSETQIPKEKLVILSCQSGKRSARAYSILQERGYDNIAEMEGGFSAWAAAGLPVNKLRNTIPIMRQVLLTAGSLILVGSILSLTISFKFVFLPLFIGAGLTFAGATGWCGMAFLLEKMPWNRT